MSDTLPKRRTVRLREYDYSLPGAYFVTICTHNREHLFSEIVCIDKSSISQNFTTTKVGAIHESPVTVLNKYGMCVDYVINQLNTRFSVNIDKYVIMPNHIHMIVVIKESDIRAIRESPLRWQRSILSKLVGYLKMNVSKKIHEDCPGKNIWQRSYNDHIIRGENDYREIWEYIDTNPIRWYNKNNPEI